MHFVMFISRRRKSGKQSESVGQYPFLLCFSFFDVKGVAAQGLAKPTPRGRRIQTSRETLDAKSEFLQA